MTTGDWFVVLGSIAALLVALVLLTVGVTRAVRLDAPFSGGIFRAPAAPWSVYALVLGAAAFVVLLTWILLPR